MATKKKTKSTVKKAVKKSNGRVILYAVLIVVFAVVAFFGVKTIFKNDGFYIHDYASSNSPDVTLYLDDTYVEYGARATAFNKDITEQVSIAYYYRLTDYDDAVLCDNIDTKTPGVYYAVYTVENFRFKAVTLVRTVTVLQPTEGSV